MFSNLLRKYYADNVELNLGSGGKTIATDEILGVQHELVKVEFGTDGNATMVSTGNPLPVTDAAVLAALAALVAGQQSDALTDAQLRATPVPVSGTVNANTGLSQPLTDAQLRALAVPVSGTFFQATQPVSGPLTDVQLRATPVPVSGTVAVTGAGDATAANQTTQITAEQAIQAAVQIMDDWDESDRAKVNLIVGQVGVAGGTGADAANVQRVSLATDIPLPAGTNVLGHVIVDSGTISIGAVDNTTLYSNTLAVTGAIAGFLTTGYASVVIQLSGTWQGNLVVEGCNDDSLYMPLLVLNANELSMADVIYGNGNFQFKTTTKYVRINVKQVAGTITALIVGRTVLGISGADTLSLAMDRGNNAPLYVEETATKKDLSKALIPSDAPAPIYGFAQATSAVIFQVDTTGYQSVVVQALTLGSNITIQTSNTGNTNDWASLLGFTGAATAPAATITTVNIWEFPVLGKFVRGVMAGANFANCLVYLRQRPVNPFNLSGGAGINIQSIGGTSGTATGSRDATNAAIVGQVGLTVGSSLAPGSTTVPNPVIVGGSEAAAPGALGGKIRTLLTDETGRLLLGGLPASQSSQNVRSVPTQDQSQFEGMSMIEIMANILIELRINNAMMNEWPQILNSDNGRFDDLAIYKNDFGNVNQ